MEYETTKKKSGKRPKKRRTPSTRKPTAPIILKSASSKKIKLDKPHVSIIKETSFNGYRILDLNILNRVLNSYVVCKSCGLGDISIVENQVKGLGSDFALQCSMYNDLTEFSSCEIIGDDKKTVMEVNRRIVYAMRCLGRIPTGIETFSGIMDLPPPVKQQAYQNSDRSLLDATRTVASESMKLAALEEVASTETDDGKHCLVGKIQNHNESINSVIWKYWPKVSFAGKSIVEIATNEAGIGFNDGLEAGRLKVMEKLQCKPGPFSIAAAQAADKRRLYRAEIQAEEGTLEIRRANRRKKGEVEAKNLSQEGTTFSAGAFVIREVYFFHYLGERCQTSDMSDFGHLQ